MPDTILCTKNKKLNKVDLSYSHGSKCLNQKTCFPKGQWLRLNFKNYSFPIINCKGKCFQVIGEMSVFNMLTNVTLDSEFSGEKSDY